MRNCLLSTVSRSKRPAACNQTLILDTFQMALLASPWYLPMPTIAVSIPDAVIMTSFPFSVRKASVFRCSSAILCLSCRAEERLMEVSRMWTKRYGAIDSFSDMYNQYRHRKTICILCLKWLWNYIGNNIGIDACSTVIDTFAIEIETRIYVNNKVERQNIACLSDPVALLLLDLLSETCLASNTFARKSENDRYISHQFFKSSYLH